MSNSNALAPLGETGELLQKLSPEMAKALPKGMDATRMVRLMMTEIRKSQMTPGPSLLDCTRESFAGALLTASALGLEPGVQGECWLIPYRDNKRNIVDCQFVIGYAGVLKLFWQHPRSELIDTQMVGANDDFRYAKGLTPVLHHVPSLDDPGEPVAYYAIAKVSDSQPIWDVFSPSEIAKLRGGRVGTRGDIPDPQHWMERKTALKQILKLAPKTTRLDTALAVDEGSGTELYRSQGFQSPAVITAPEARSVQTHEIMAEPPAQVPPVPTGSHILADVPAQEPWPARPAADEPQTQPPGWRELVNEDGYYEPESGGGMAADKGGERPAADGTPPPPPDSPKPEPGELSREVIGRFNDAMAEGTPTPGERTAKVIGKFLDAIHSHPDDKNTDDLPRHDHDPAVSRRVFALLLKAGIDCSPQDRDKYLAIFRHIRRRQDIYSTDHLSPDELEDVRLVLNSWDKMKVLQKRVDEVLLTVDQDRQLDDARDAADNEVKGDD